MEQIIVYGKYATWFKLMTKSPLTSITKAEQKRTLLDEDIINMTVESDTPLNFQIGDRITIFGDDYYLNNLPKFQKEGKRRFIYDLTWEGIQYDLIKVIYFDEGDDGKSISSDFSLTGTLQTFMDVLINNLERVYGIGKWVLGDCPTTDYLTLTFSNENCLAVLQRLCNEDNFNQEFEIINSSGYYTINIKDSIGQVLPHVYEYGKGKGLYNLTRETVSNRNIITRLYAFGASKNLASDYRGFSQRLKLPSVDLSYIEDAPAKTAFGLIEGVKCFDDIYPHRSGTVTSLGSTVYEFIDSGMDFDLNAVDGDGNTIYLINGTAAKIHFNTGNLAGYEFEISSYNHGTKKFIIKAFKDERGQVFPDTETSAFQIVAGDKYVIIDIILPQSYITAAESALLSAAEDYLEQNCQPRVQYSLTIDEIYLRQYYPGETIVNVYNAGDYLPVKDSDVGVDKDIRIKSFTRDIFNYYRYTLSLSDITESSIIERILASSNETEKIIDINKLNDIGSARSTSAVRELSNIANDNVLSKNEKPLVKKDYDIIIGEQSGIDAKATAYSITTEKATYDDAITALTTYLTGLSPAYTDFNQNTKIVGDTFRIKFHDVYISRQALLNKIYEKAKLLADNAQAAADDAQDAADDAQADATSALTELGNIASDSILSKDEKPPVKLDYDTLIAEQSGIDAKATQYGITTEKTAYDTAVTALTTYITGLSPAYTDFTQNTTIVGATFRTKFQTVYTTRQTLLNKIYDKAIELETNTGDYSGHNCNIMLKEADMWENAGIYDDDAIHINRKGYNGGVTKYKSVIFYNGKGVEIMRIRGSDGKIILSGDLSIASNTETSIASEKINLHAAHAFVDGTSDITGSASETDMSGMTLTIYPRGDAVLVIFSAPFNVSAANQTLHLYIYVGGYKYCHAKHYITSGFNQVTFSRIVGVTPGASTNIKIRWLSSTSVRQLGSTDAERVLNVIDLM